MNRNPAAVCRSAGRWLTAPAVFTAGLAVAWLASSAGAADLRLLCAAPAGYALLRHAALAGWCRGWVDRSMLALAEELRRDQ